MTERTFKKAKELNDEIKRLCEEKDILEKAQKLCWGNTSDVQNRIFRVNIGSPNVPRAITEVKVSCGSAKLALDLEIKRIEDTLAALRKEFSEL